MEYASSSTKILLALVSCAFVLSSSTADAAAANDTGVLAKSLCKEVAFGCPIGYECRTPKEGCQSHCDCYDPVANESLPPGCPVRIKPCEEGHFCMPDKAGECHTCNCDTPCSQATGRFSCKPKANQACTRRMARGSCPVCQCEDCPPRVCPRDCYVIQLDAGCKEVCICTGKDGIPFALLNSATYSYQ
ncbi:uncharacterized protein LOC119375499 [Rhipicephalus sanguineus]|uniref:uncharacterized protein LOC119375499 n=1 Tax=Rhipicephalus sanguineus TaxID=34632 RepID=UPI001893C7D5|nr:uncharacterized protein LOC119375499 [Rhipicephalus sanguineus]